MLSFSALGIPDSLVSALESLGIRDPAPVQALVIPEILARKNVLFEAETGSGKTFAYALPLIHRCSRPEASRFPAICVVCPTQELASQQKKALESLLPGRGPIPLLIGGVPVRRQIESLQKNPWAVVGCPARLCELAFLKKLRLQELQALVLDEADRLFSRELEEFTLRLVNLAPRETQLIGLSATIDKKTEAVFEKLRPDAGKVRIEAGDVLRKNIDHQALFAEDRDKIRMLMAYLRAEAPPKALIFCARLDWVEKIASALRAKNFDCAALHGKAAKLDRKGAVDRFRSGKTPLLVTSDLSARGLDIPDITHIVQMDLPEQTAFIHRAGRTARMGKRGVNMVIGNEWEMRQYAALEKRLGLAVYPKMMAGGKVVNPPMDAGSSPA